MSHTEPGLTTATLSQMAVRVGRLLVGTDARAAGVVGGWGLLQKVAGEARRLAIACAEAKDHRRLAG